jgi:hypothetical protein
VTRSTQKELDEAQKRIASGLRDLPAQYVQCRGMLHAWEVLNDFRITGAQNQRGPRFLRRDLTCMRGCGTVRHDTFLLRFVAGEPMISEKLHASYTYPEDYQIPGIPRGVKRQVIVYQEQFRRAMEAAGGVLPGEREVSD